MSFFQDIKFAARRLVKEPAFTAVVVVVLALGIGANTTIFTLANAVLFRGLPFEHSDRLMYLSTNELARNRNDIEVSYPDFRDWRAEAKTFKGLGGFSGTAVVITDSSNPPERYSGVA